MRIIVDANIVFSAIIKTDGRIGDLIINSKGVFKFITTDFLRIEIKRHYNKLIKISKLSIDQIMESEFQLYKSINFISDEQISDSSWKYAKSLVQDIDIKDLPYVAFTKQFKAKLWSGDLQLVKGISKKGFKNYINTSELWDIRQKRIKEKDK